MRVLALLVVLLAMTGCRDDEATGSTSLSFGEKLYPSHNPNSFEQCVSMPATSASGDTCDLQHLVSVKGRSLIDLSSRSGLLRDLSQLAGLLISSADVA